MAKKQHAEQMKKLEDDKNPSIFAKKSEKSLRKGSSSRRSTVGRKATSGIAKEDPFRDKRRSDKEEFK